MNEIEVNNIFFKKIYKFTEIYCKNISKSFAYVYITINIEFYENKLNADNARHDNMEDVNADAHSVKTSDSYSYSTCSISSKKRKKSKKDNKKNKLETTLPYTDGANHGGSGEEDVGGGGGNDCSSNANAVLSQSSSSLNLNKIKNIILNDKVEESKNIRIVPIQKKIQSIIKKVTNNIESEIMKQYINYKLIIDHSKKKNDVNKLNAFYHLILNNIDSGL